MLRWCFKMAASEKETEDVYFYNCEQEFEDPRVFEFVEATEENSSSKAWRSLGEARDGRLRESSSMIVSRLIFSRTIKRRRGKRWARRNERIGIRSKGFLRLDLWL